MISKIKQALKTRFSDLFWKNVATLFTGSALAQALPIAFLPIITRLYSKEALGFYFVYAAICMLSQILSSFQYQLAIILPKKQKDADALLGLNALLSLITAALLALIIFLFFDLISSYIEQKVLVQWLYLIPFSTFLLGIFNALSYYLNRQEKYTTISIAKVSKSATFTILQLIFAFIGFMESGLILGLIAGQLVSMGVLLFFVFKKTDFIWKSDLKTMKTLFFKYKDIPLFNTFILFLNTLSNQMPLFFLTSWFGVEAAGDYGLANRMVATPLGLIGGSVGQVFYKEGADIHNRGESLSDLVKTTCKRLIKLGAIPFVLLLLLAPWIFKIVFGADYDSTGEITRILLPWLFVMFINSPLSYIITILNKQRIMVFYGVFLLIARLIAFFTGYYFMNSMMLSIVLYSVVGLIFNLFFLAYVLFLSKSKNSNTYT